MTHVSTSVSDICSTALFMTTCQTIHFSKRLFSTAISSTFLRHLGGSHRKTCVLQLTAVFLQYLGQVKKHDDSNCSPSDAAAPLQLLHGCCHKHHIVFTLIHCYFFLQHLGRFSQECEAHGKHVHVSFPPLGTSVPILTDIYITRVRSLGVSTATLSFTFITDAQIILHLLLGAWRGEHCHH